MIKVDVDEDEFHSKSRISGKISGVANENLYANTFYFSFIPISQ